MEYFGIKEKNKINKHLITMELATNPECKIFFDDILMKIKNKDY